MDPPARHATAPADAEDDDDDTLVPDASDGPAHLHPRAVRLEFRVDPHLGGARADLYLSHRIRRLSRTRAAAVIARGDLRRADESLLRPASRVAALETLVLYRVPPDASPPDMRFTLLLEDDALVVLDKPPGVAVHPSARYYSGTLTQLFLRRGYPLSNAPDAVRVPHPVHRLDRETSGVLVCARAAHAEKTWKDAFLHGRVHKTYLALCAGEPAFESTILDQPLGLLSGLPVRIKMGPVAGGQPARTDVDVLWRGQGRCLLRCTPRTGRTHQIRAHLAAAGFPVLGDKLYGPQGDEWFREYADHGLTPALEASLDHPRHALHAAVLEGAGFRFVAGWPEDLVTLAPAAADVAQQLLAREPRVPNGAPRTWWARRPPDEPA